MKLLFPTISLLVTRTPWKKNIDSILETSSFFRSVIAEEPVLTEELELVSKARKVAESCNSIVQFGGMVKSYKLTVRVRIYLFDSSQKREGYIQLEKGVNFLWFDRNL